MATQLDAVFHNLMLADGAGMQLADILPPHLALHLGICVSTGLEHLTVVNWEEKERIDVYRGAPDSEAAQEISVSFDDAEGIVYKAVSKNLLDLPYIFCEGEEDVLVESLMYDIFPDRVRSWAQPEEDHVVIFDDTVNLASPGHPANILKTSLDIANLTVNVEIDWDPAQFSINDG